DTALGLQINPEKLPKDLNKPRFPILSPTDGRPFGDALLKPDYWRNLLVQPSTEASPCLNAQEFDLVLSIGPRAEHTPSSATPSSSPQWLASLPPALTGDSSAPFSVWETLLTSLSQLYIRGSKINWRGFDKGYLRESVSLPTYAWQRRRYWIDSVERSAKPVQSKFSLDPAQVMNRIQTTDAFSETELQVLPKLIDWLNQTAFPSNEPIINANVTGVATSNTNGAMNGKANGLSFNSNGSTPSSTEAVESLAPKVISTGEIQTWLIERIAQELGVTPTEINPDEPFDAYGLDSVLAIGIASAGKQAFGVEVTPLMLVHYPSVTALSRHIAASFETAETEMFEF
ncbi:MAG: phosphopantetheine-binding protein, partial [Cyanobacteria bacterium P01_F01_bin.150]